jgi:hypothetical protein
LPKQRRHHNTTGIVRIKNGYVYKQNKKIAEKLGIKFGKIKEKEKCVSEKALSQ